MLIDIGIAKKFWAESVNITCYVINRCLIKFILEKTSYDILNKINPKISYLRAFGYKCIVLNNGKDDLRKSDLRSDEGIFVGYSLNRKAYNIFNKLSVWKKVCM